MRPWPEAERALGPLLLGLLAVPVLPAPARTQQPPATEEARALTGRVTTRYRARFTGDQDDHDLYETLDLAFRDPERGWSGALLAHASLDLDGRSASEDADFFGLQDTYDHRLQGQLYHAYLDWNSGAFALLRFGRQPLYETPVTVFLDGLRVELAPRGARRLSLGLYGGIGQHLYESSHQGDLVLGTFAALHPWSGSELRADWMRLEDARLGVDHEDDLLGLSLAQDLVRDEHVTRLAARFTALESESRDLRLDTSLVDGAHAFTLQGSLYRLLRTQYQLAAPLDPFSDTLFELFPYTQLGASAGKDWAHLGLLGGADVRRVEDSGDVGPYNRDFERYFLTATLPDALPVVVSLTGELWHADGTDFETWGASLARELDGGWDATLGSSYSLYRYDLLAGEERDDVRTTYLDLRWKPAPTRRWTLRYELEQNDFDDFHQLRLDYAWSF